MLSELDWYAHNLHPTEVAFVSNINSVHTYDEYTIIA